MSKFIYLSVLLFFLSCEDSQSNEIASPKISSFVETYAAIAYANYSDALASAKVLKTKVDAFVSAPTAGSHEQAKRAWLDAREYYGQTETFRFYGGPIDNETNGPEGDLNSWPLDESFIDYVSESDFTTGIINDTSIALTKEYLRSNNALDPEEVNVTIGYHAVEFLLWGVDNNADGPGTRSFNDYVEAHGKGFVSVVQNQTRRGLYLKLVAEMIVEDLETVVAAWAPNTSNYRLDFVALPSKVALTKIINAMGKLAQGELAGERIAVALAENDQEHEHSCFSDNTHRDIILNAKGIQNVFLGQYGSIKGIGLYEIVKARDANLASEMLDNFTASEDAVEAIPYPFDQAIIPTNGVTQKVQTAITALRAEATNLVHAAALFGITVDPDDI